jgi:hypothetical protein
MHNEGHNCGQVKITVSEFGTPTTKRNTAKERQHIKDHQISLKCE